MRIYPPIKRTLDIAATVALAPAWLPVCAVVAAAVRATSGAPVLFFQERAGRGGRVFRIVKFRTMRIGEGPDDARITGLGRFLRKTGLDELPQLFNVLRGDMSIVGPRPLLPEYLPRYTPEQARRHDVAPGITGLAQVNGRNATTWEERFAYDCEYVRRQSLWLDAAIVAKTLWRLMAAPFRRGGAAAGDEAVMPPFGEEKV